MYLLLSEVVAVRQKLLVSRSSESSLVVDRGAAASGLNGCHTMQDCKIISHYL